MHHKQISRFLWVVFFAAMLLANACKHSSEDHSSAPVLTIKTPAEGAVIQGAVQITLSVSDDESLHYMTVVVTRNSDGKVVFTEDVTVHDEISHDYDKWFTPTGLTGDTPMTLTVEVEDHDENKTTKTVKFTAKP